MRVSIAELLEGCILAEDIFSLTNRPIIAKKTVINQELIGILSAFLIPNVAVEKTLIDGQPFIPSEIIEEEIEEMGNEQPHNEQTFTDLFLNAVKEFKREFLSWQSGLPVDIIKIRKIMMPLAENLDHYYSELFTLHHLSTMEEYPFQHSISVGLFSAYIGRKLNYKNADIIQLSIAGCLADCGMAKVPEKILFKKSSLTIDEFEEIKQHPYYSFKMVQNSSLLAGGTKLAILQHHERLDGSGYPRGETNRIHSFAKIIAIADTFHALTSERLYRRKQSPFKVLEMMKQDDFGKFDLTSLKALQSGLLNYSIGSTVKLSNGQVGEIIFVNEQNPTRPMIKLIASDEIIQLEKNRQIFIEEITNENGVVK
ncbi:HD-GYP domain-containing protein [Cytobacillus sp. Hz8]|uniref:HD-GYP domain-containing protein n=1 Tax=Cytobacillus sp. Hz8 TaxID=3347168 RepID=UPI0035DEFFF2